VEQMSQLDHIIQKLGNVERHIDVLNSELGEVAIILAVLENKVADILWLQRLILATVVIAVVGSILNLVLKKRNAKS